MWIVIFELPSGDIESVALYWDKQVCYESVAAEQYGLDEEGYVKDGLTDLGRNRIIEIKDEKVNQLFMYLLNKYIVECDPDYLYSLICGRLIESWI